MKNYLIVNKNNFFKGKLKNTKKKKFYYITKKKDFTINKIKNINPRIIFFPHWSWIVNNKILDKYFCVGFHSTPLPYGRGGSPIHNMILRGFAKTSICAFKIEKKLDSGPVYMRVKLGLKGSGSWIFRNMYKKIIFMIKQLSTKLPKPTSQKGKATYFKRLLEKDGQIKSNYSVKKIYNIIRSLDMKNKNYVSAHFKLGNIRLYFTDAKYKNKKITAKVILKKTNY